MAFIDLTERQALLLVKVLNGTLIRDGGRTGPDWRQFDPDLAELVEALGRLRFEARHCLVCGAAFEAKNPRKTTCSDRCRQALSRSNRAGKPAPTPAPVEHPCHGETVTPSALDPRDALAATKRRFDAEWELLKADAKPSGCDPERVQRFRLDHKLGFTDPLTPAALDQLRREVELEAVASKGEKEWIAERLAAIDAVSAADLSALVSLVLDTPAAPWTKAIPAYLKAVKEHLTAEQWKNLQQQIESRCPSVPPAMLRLQRALFFGVLLRLPDLGPIPTDPAAFPEWSGLDLQQQHQRRVSFGATGLDDLAEGRMSENTARQVLELPLGVELTRDGIRSAYRSLAALSHPDRDGGDVDRFQRLKAAQDRLLLAVG